MGHMVEEICLEDIQRWEKYKRHQTAEINKLNEHWTSYDQQGNIIGKMEMQPPEPIKLFWDFGDELLKIIDEAYQDGLKVIQVRKIWHW